LYLGLNLLGEKDFWMFSCKSKPVPLGENNFFPKALVDARGLLNGCLLTGLVT
jgi:hypothetical protein